MIIFFEFWFLQFSTGSPLSVIPGKKKLSQPCMHFKFILITIIHFLFVSFLKFFHYFLSHWQYFRQNMLCAIDNNFLNFFQRCFTWDFADVFLAPFFIIPRAGTSTGTVVVFNFHMIWISISKFLYLLNLSNSFTKIFSWAGLLTSIN